MFDSFANALAVGQTLVPASSWYTGPTTQLAWFFQRPLYDPPDWTTSIHDILAQTNHKLFVLSGSDVQVAPSNPADQGFGWATTYDAFVGLGVNPANILEYVNMPNTMGPAGTSGCVGDPTYEGFSISWTSRASDFCSRLDGTEAVFLHTGGISRTHRFNGEGGSPEWWHMNPGSSVFRSYVGTKAVENYADFKTGGLTNIGTNGFSKGIFLDNAWSNVNTARNDAGGPLNEYADSPASDAQWQSDVSAMLTGIKNGIHSYNSLGELWGNAGGISQNEDAYLSVMDGFMFETWVTNFDGDALLTQAQVESNMSQVDAIVAAGKSALLVPQGNAATDHALMQYSHAAYLLVAAPKVYFRFQNAADYRRFWDFPEYDFNIGTPLESRVLLPSRRMFSGGIALCNMSDTLTETSYVLPVNCYKPDNTGPFTTITLSPNSGVMLRYSL